MSKTQVPRFYKQLYDDIHEIHIGVFGNGELARVARYYLEEKRQIINIKWKESTLAKHKIGSRKAECKVWRTVDESYIKLDDKITIPFEYVEPEENERSAIFLPTGYKDCNNLRRIKTEEAKKKGLGIVSVLDKRANLDATKVGSGCWVQEGCNVQTGSELGDGVILWASSHVGHGSKVGDFCWITTHATICGEVEIGDQTFVGANAVITPGVSIGKRCIIGSGAIITKDLPDDTVAVEGRNNIIAKKSYEINMR